MLLSFFGVPSTPSMSQATTPDSGDLPPNPPSFENSAQDSSRHPDDPARDSPSSTPSASIQYPSLHAATTDYQGGHRSFLDVIFDERLSYEGLRPSILQGLNTLDFDNMRQACRTIDNCLMTPKANGSLRYPPLLVDKCHETELPNPPSVGPLGSCPNPPNNTVRIRTCQYYEHVILRNGHQDPTFNAHPRDYLVCEVCRRNWHDNIGTDPILRTQNTMNRHDYWRVLLAGAHITVCSLCDQEQKEQYSPEGHDGCVCYHNYYKKWWLCHRCDMLNSAQIHHRAGFLINAKRNLKQVGDEIAAMPQAQGPKELPQFLSWCPCGRQVTEPSPRRIQTVPTPWPGNHHLIVAALNHDTGVRRKITKQCVLCCGYIVPPGTVPGAAPRRETRRSARLADRRLGRQRERKHTMLGRNGKAATRLGVNDKGFEI